MRAWELAASSAIGLGAGALAYRYGVLGPDWQGPGALAVPACAIGIIAIGARGVQRLAPIAWWLRALAIAGGITLGFTIAYVLLPAPAPAALHERRFGALVIELPDGDVREGPSIVTVGGVGIAWRTGAPDDATMDAMIAGAARGMGGRVAGPADELVVGGGLARRAARLDKDGMTGWVAVFGCGDRVFGVFTVGDGAQALEARVLASVRCDAAATPAPR